MQQKQSRQRKFKPRARILLVDDNETLLKILANRLSRKQFEVCAFSESIKAQEFMDLLAKQDEFHIDILVSDVLMPHVNGRQLAEKFHVLYPELPVIFMSAYTDDILSPDGQFILAENEFFMRKPFSPKELIEHLNDLLIKGKPDESEHDS